jgi:putative addiction module component (TIGR02574 family)
MSDEERLFSEALRLPAAARADLAERLLISVDAEDAGEVDEAWHLEVDRRAAELDAGAVQAVSGTQVRERLRARLNEFRKNS